MRRTVVVVKMKIQARHKRPLTSARALYQNELVFLSVPPSIGNAHRTDVLSLLYTQLLGVVEYTLYNHYSPLPQPKLGT